MTYREKLQQFIEEMQALYDKAGVMRDNAFDQDAFNATRNHLYNAFQPLMKHDDELTEAQAKARW